MRQAWQDGQLPRCTLVFPNVELRLTAGSKAAQVNVHLLVSPDDDDHLYKLDALLRRLEFRASDRQVYCCHRSDLVRLGRLHDPTVADDEAALRVGANQFKVDFDQLCDVLNDAWAQENVLLAVAAGKDGASGMADSAQEMRRGIEGRAHAIFSGNPRDREFWLGRDPVKPCLHGSDAHGLDKVGRPDMDRRCWIRGGVDFDALRQACIAPERVHIGAEPPTGPAPSDVVREVRLDGAGWGSARVPINPGLVAIIGARGSGKSAFLEAVAAACGAITETSAEGGFLDRARDRLAGAAAEVTWGAGAIGRKPLDRPHDEGPPRVRHLSQKFVDRLCGGDGMSDELLVEIEQVVFRSLAEEDREGALDFATLREVRCDRHRKRRCDMARRLAATSEAHHDEMAKVDALPALRTRLEGFERDQARLEGDRTRLIGDLDPTVARNRQAIEAALATRNTQVRDTNAQLAALDRLASEVEALEREGIAAEHDELKARHAATGPAVEEWLAFRRPFAGDVGAELPRAQEAVRAHLAALKGVAPARLDPTAALIPEGEALDSVPLAVLTTEAARLDGLMKLDDGRRRQRDELTGRIARAATDAEVIRAQIADAEGAEERSRAHLPARDALYARVFGELLAEEQVLRDLYAPIDRRIGAAGGDMQKLALVVEREVDAAAWIAAGEELLDLRKAARGWLEGASGPLLAAWHDGDATAIGIAMATFRGHHSGTLTAAMPPADQADAARRRDWLRRLARWLYGTSHVQLRYGLRYDGTDIGALSPGTRGVVLLLLMLALDDADPRPLLIDQPEENLDPQSIQDVLVPLFREARRRRQVIMVTHNANLVVNADVDQVIVATCGPRQGAGLPPMTHEGGSLDEERIRDQVCRILEGGEAAFRERARRLRLPG